MRNWIRKHAIILSLIPVVAVMGMIFWFSAQNGEDSGQMSGNLTRWLVELVVPGWEEMSQDRQQMLLSRVSLVIRKLGHFSEYALLGFFLMLHLRQICRQRALCWPWAWCWGVGTAYAISDELHQGFVGGRNPAVTDVLIDSCGVIAGAAFLIWTACMWRRRKRRPGQEKTGKFREKSCNPGRRWYNNICQKFPKRRLVQMDMLKKFFPYSFGAADVKALVIKIVVYLVVSLVAGLVLGLAGLITGWIPLLGAVVGLVLKLVGWVVELYVVVGIVLAVLDYLKVLK